MAIGQGICTNCGSLIMLEDREELCECLFCNCVFPTAEALLLAENAEGHEFLNEPQEKMENSRRLTVTPVFHDPVPAAVAREDKKKAIEKEAVVEYEVSPDDVKPPKKVVKFILMSAAAFLGLLVLISVPLFLTRNNHRNEITNHIQDVFTEFEVDTEKADGYYTGFFIDGQQNTNLSVSTDDEIDEDAVYATFENYALLRAREYGVDESNFAACYKPVSLRVYTSSGIYSIQADSPEQLSSEFVKKVE